MRIGIFGAGSVGSALGRGWAKAGHTVTFGVRDTANPKVMDLVREIDAKSGSLADAAATADVVMLSTPWPATHDALIAAGDLAGKVILDCTNPFAPDLESLELSNTTSGGEQVAVWAPGAWVVKIFNTVGSNVMADPVFGGEGISLLYCGDDAAAKETAAQLASDIGFDPIDAGPLKYSRWLEAFAMLWVRQALDHQDRDIAFKLVRR